LYFDYISGQDEWQTEIAENNTIISSIAFFRQKLSPSLNFQKGDSLTVLNN